MEIHTLYPRNLLIIGQVRSASIPQKTGHFWNTSSGIPSFNVFTEPSSPEPSGAITASHALKRSRPRFAKWGLPRIRAYKHDFAPDNFRELIAFIPPIAIPTKNPYLRLLEP